MLGLNYMNSSKGELCNCLNNMCNAMADKSVLILMYANRHAVNAFRSSSNCSITMVSPGNDSEGCNFKIGGDLVDTLEYFVDEKDVTAILSGRGLQLTQKQSNLSWLGNSMRWTRKANAKPLAEAMTICNLYISEIWVKPGTGDVQ